VGLGFRVTELVMRVVVVPMPHNNGKPHPWTLPMSLFFSSVETRQSIKLFCVLLKFKITLCEAWLSLNTK
jgi:hypothetical protein